MNKNYIVVIRENGVNFKVYASTQAKALAYMSERIAEIQQYCKDHLMVTNKIYAIYHYGKEIACYCDSWSR